MLMKNMIFRTREKDYQGKSAVDIVRELERDAADYPYKGGTLWQFLLWSLLKQLPGDIAISELGLNSQLGDETLALGYLYACDEYGVGELIDAPCLAR